MGALAGGTWLVVRNMQYSTQKNVVTDNKLISVYRHIMTAIAAYINLTWDIWLRHCRLNGKQDGVQLVRLSWLKGVPAMEQNHKPKLL